MHDHLLNAVYRERVVLQARLNELPAFRKLVEVQKLIETYERFERPVRGDSRKPKARNHVRRSGTVSERAEAAVVRHLVSTGERATSSVLMRVLTDEGIAVGGRNPSQNLAAILTTSARIDNDRRGGGYGLIEWTAAEGR